ncbi:MAG: aldehyde ferredoxin oxidoreductase family protein [Rhodospirillaceae bacterium]|jgi:aldehyde:ferredoxin oxidoreductase|nr:aldehyde ferredoxin oxidoreductase family protein [Rhodospirillaceae bacterium]MBT5658966.1 aldehyde ferredoxin oxidoreductase family protein [Rhodospirillaceae bacterium]MBT5753130.1 aldehyde ferredoxin oxidoreductase family protein [Rhodospirillaceae bacterium]
MGWHKKVLRVNLTKGTCIEEPLNMKWADSYLGQRGLASKYLCEEIDPKVDPLSPDNKMIFATGPLTGTSASTGGRYSVITKGPLTNCIACSNSGGYWGAELKFAGWDMIIVEGKSKKPVYLFIENDKVELLPAKELWGKTVWETEPWIKSHHQDPQIKVSSIGRAGENGVLYAGVINDLHRAAGRSGVGAVMGSKNLKAIAVRGTKGVPVDNPKEFMKATGDGKKVLAENAVTGEGLPTYGTQVLMNIINEIGAMPTRNHREVQFDGSAEISGEAMHEKRKTDGKANLVTNQACFGCTIACGRISKIDESHYTIVNKPEYWHASGGLEYEAAWAMGSDAGIDDLEALTYANFICNEDGYDPISFGATVAAAMELFEEGAITEKDTGGLKLNFGSVEAMTTLAELTARGEGFGKDIGLGSKRLCEKYGRPEISMTVKGQEFPAYDPRGIQGIGLAYATSNRGACHLRGYTVASEVMGIPEKTDPLVTEGKAGLVKAFQDATAVVDSAGICVFTTFAWSMEDIQPQINAACEGDWSLDNLMAMGERIWNLERKFNLDAGITAADDTLPTRLLKDAGKTGPAKGKVNELGKMLPEYYELRGWTKEGVPTNKTCDRLGL